jgi:threonyl-tRNA synthetase
MALLIEHYAGKYPFWLSPRPAIILALNQDPELLNHVSHLQKVLSGLQLPDSSPSSKTDKSAKPAPQPLSAIHLPIDVDTTARPLGKKIADAQKKKYNHIIVIGPNEVSKLEVVNQPNLPMTEQVLRQVIGREMKEEEKKRGKIAVGMDAKEARSYFENLVNTYL